MALFEQLLDQCLQDLTHTGEVEASLRRYPGNADQLRPLLEMAQATRGYYETVPAAPSGLAAGRERFLAAAAEQRERGVSAASGVRTTDSVQGRGTRLGLSLRSAVAVLALVVIVTLLGSGLVWAASDSLPGDLLYPVKLTTEDVRLALASGPGDQVNLALGFVEERAGEMQALAAAGAGIPDETVVRMERQVERALTQTALAEGEKMSGLLKQVAARTSTQAQRLAGLHASAPQQAQAGLERATTALRRSARAAEEGLNDPATFRWRYRQRAGEPEITPEPEQERQQHQNREQKQQSVPAPLGTPRGTPGGTRATATPNVTPQAGQATTTSHGLRLTASPRATSYRPQATSTPEPTPQGLHATTKPKDTPQQPEATATPQPIPQEPGPTATPHTTHQGSRATPGHPGGTSEPLPPGGGHSGGGH